MTETCKVIKKEILALVFSCDLCKISKNTFFTEHVWATASISVSNPQVPEVPECPSALSTLSARVPSEFSSAQAPSECLSALREHVGF